ncbi:dolichyl-phosphate-mannose--protein mannosyltransferase [Microbacterium sp. YY-01]|uniref:dolichyl-phosphate-mannose--protein mannosyltransferase n=1 Tax=Microbacterium sp. YY-01 TaxID=3421634 RepID=UPI003D16D436
MTSARLRLSLPWLLPALVTMLAAAARLWNVGHPATLAFDETYYVKDAWSLWQWGYEGKWGENANELFAQGDTSALGTDGSFVVHPPLGKWLIALGMALLGPGSSVGWRLATAILGAATVLLVYFITRELTQSVAFATVAGLLLAVDGLGIVMSRIALLDTIVTFFIVLAFLFVLYDRRQNGEHPRHEQPPVWGTIVARRPWIIAAGVALGAATAVKWSGAYALAGIGIYLVVTDALARRRAGVVQWPADAAFRQGPVTFLLLVPAAVVTYVVSWSGWLLTRGGYDRDSSTNPLIALWNYHRSIYNFHISLSAGHSYASPAWEWPLLLRPTAVWVGGQQDTECWGSDHCIAVISTIPNPVTWYLGVAAVLYLMYRVVLGWFEKKPASWTLSVPLVGIAVTYVPWLLVPDRTIFQFYTVAMLPFIVIALTLVLHMIAHAPDATPARRQAGRATVVTIVVIIVLVSLFYYPVWTGMTVPYKFWLLHNWLPGWI